MLNNNADTGYITFDDIVDAVLLEKGMDKRYYPRVLGICIRGYKLLYRKAIAGVKTVLLEFDNPNLRIINNPLDYVDYRKIGCMVNYGKNQTPVVMTLSRNDRLYQFTNEDIAEANCTCEEADTVEDNVILLADGLMPFDTYTVFKNVIRGNQVVGEIWGAGGGMSRAGSFREDKENFRFIFSNDVPMDAIIVMEYKSSGIEKGADTKVPIAAEEAMVEWCRWRLDVDNRNQERLFEKAARELNRNQKSVTMSEIIDVLSSTTLIKYG